MATRAPRAGEPDGGGLADAAGAAGDQDDLARHRRVLSTMTDSSSTQRWAPAALPAPTRGITIDAVMQGRREVASGSGPPRRRAIRPGDRKAIIAKNPKLKIPSRSRPTNHALLSSCQVFSRAPIHATRPAIRPPAIARPPTIPRGA